MRPFGAAKSGEFGIIFKVNSRNGGLLQERVPGFRAGRGLIFELFEAAANGQSNENKFPAAPAQFFHRGNDVGETFLNCLADFGHEFFFRNVTWWRRRSKKRNPNLLNHASELSVWI